jgi:hypothetical protein
MIDINSGFLSSIGIVFDIIGAFFLAESFLLKKYDRILKESSSFWGGNPFLLPSLITQRIEAKTGFIFLMLGFLLQMISNADFVNQGRDKDFWLILVFGLTLWLISMSIIKFWSKSSGQSALITEYGANFLKSLDKAEKKDQKGYSELAHFYGDALDLKKDNNEDDCYHAKKVRSFIANKITKQNNNKNNNYFSFVTFLWRKKYKHIIGIACVILILLILFIGIVTNEKILINWSDKIYYSILLLTAGVIFWYSRETADLKDISNKSIKELRKQVFLQQRPFIRLQWLAQENFGIRIINEGSGIAVNLSIMADKKPTINRSIVAAEKACKSFTDAGFADAGLPTDQDFEKIYSPTQLYNLAVNYSDIAGNKYSQEFRTNASLNDKFELTEWDMPEDFEKVKLKRVNIV